MLSWSLFALKHFVIFTWKVSFLFLSIDFPVTVTVSVLVRYLFTLPSGTPYLGTTAQSRHTQIDMYDMLSYVETTYCQNNCTFWKFWRFPQTGAWGNSPSTSRQYITIKMLKTLLRQLSRETQIDVAPEVLKTLHPFEDAVCAFDSVCESGMRVLICSYSCTTLYALFRYLGFLVWSWWYCGIFPPTSARPDSHKSC